MSSYTCMTLGRWIDALGLHPAGMRIVLDLDGPANLVGRLASWRGSYEQLAIAPAAEGDRAIYRTVGEALRAAQTALDHEFTGYKGGEYVMTRDTPLWISPWGESQEVRPIGIEVLDRDGQEIAQVVTAADCLTL